MCDRCAQLEEEIAWLRSELGLQQRADQIEKIKALFPTWSHDRTSRPQCAELLMALYNAKGRPVTHAQLAERVSAPTAREERCMEAVKVWVYGVRNTLGYDTISNVRGFGYKLTENGMARIAQALA